MTVNFRNYLSVNWRDSLSSGEKSSLCNVLPHSCKIFYYFSSDVMCVNLSVTYQNQKAFEVQKLSKQISAKCSKIVLNPFFPKTRFYNVQIFSMKKKDKVVVKPCMTQKPNAELENPIFSCNAIPAIAFPFRGPEKTR